MARANKGYEIRPMVCDWALDIPMGYTTFVLYFSSRNNAELVKEVLEWEDAHPNEATPYQPTLTPPNEWVSVDNKLPKNGVPVLIGNPHWDYPVVASCAGYGVWMDSWHQKMTFTPTYWMPLPERPKEDE